MDLSHTRIAVAGLLTGIAGFHLAGAFAGISFALIGGALAFLVPLAKTRVERQSLSRDVLVVKVRGPLTFLAQGTLERLLSESEHPAHLVLDLTGVSLVDAGGMTEIANVIELVSRRDTRVVMAASSAVRARLDAGARAGVRRANVVAAMDDALATVFGRRRQEPTPDVLPEEGSLRLTA